MKNDTALIVVDAQNDFVHEKGSMAIKDAILAIPNINTLIKNYTNIYYSMDWHPKDHISFKTWPEHCVEFTWGAELHDNILTKAQSSIYIIKKGQTKMEDSYSAFGGRPDWGYYTQKDTFANILYSKGIENVIVCGYATDYCVYETALDSTLKYNFITYLPIDACRLVYEASIAPKIKHLADNGVIICQTRHLI